MTSPSEMAIDHPMAAEDDEDTRERMPDPAGPLPTENPQPAAPATAWRPGATVMASPADEPEVAGQGDADRSMTFPVPDAEPEPVPGSPAASATASESTRWHEIQVTFVDDPRSAVELAAGLVDDSSQALVAFVKEQQDSLRAAWRGEDAGTEELRVALQHYRAFGTRLAAFSRET
jgi:cytoskeletal protein RodZ